MDKQITKQDLNNAPIFLVVTRCQHLVKVDYNYLTVMGKTS